MHQASFERICRIDAVAVIERLRHDRAARDDRQVDTTDGDTVVLHEGGVDVVRGTGRQHACRYGNRTDIPGNSLVADSGVDQHAVATVRLPRVEGELCMS